MWDLGFKVLGLDFDVQKISVIQAKGVGAYVQRKSLCSFVVLRTDAWYRMFYLHRGIIAICSSTYLCFKSRMHVGSLMSERQLWFSMLRSPATSSTQATPK